MLKKGCSSYLLEAKICVLVQLRLLKSKMTTVRIIAVPFKVLSQKELWQELFVSQLVFIVVSFILIQFEKKNRIVSIAIENYHFKCHFTSCFSKVPLRIKIHFSHDYQTRFWYLWGCFSKISDEHPHHFYLGDPVPAPGDSFMHNLGRKQ